MRTATLQIYYYSDVFVHIELQWIWAMSVEYGYWRCPPGYFGRRVAAGTWDTRWLTNDLVLFDSEREVVAYAQDMEVSLIGYPLGGLEGDKGDFRVFPAGQGGVLGSRPLWWRLL